VWETDPRRAGGATGYTVTTPEADARRDYRVIADVTGDSGLLDTLIGRLAPRGELVLGGFYAAPIRYAFPPAFMREARLRDAAEWPPDQPPRPPAAGRPGPAASAVTGPRGPGPRSPRAMRNEG